jgi:hypothetical protein
MKRNMTDFGGALRHRVQSQRKDRWFARQRGRRRSFLKNDIITTLLAAHKMAQSRCECGIDDATVGNLQLFCVARVSVRTTHPLGAPTPARRRKPIIRDPCARAGPSKRRGTSQSLTSAAARPYTR